VGLRGGIMTLEGTPFHEPFIALLWIVVGIPVGLLILATFLALLTAKVMAISIVLAVAGAMVLYIAGVIALTFTWVYEQLTGRPAPWTVVPEPEPEPEHAAIAAGLEAREQERAAMEQERATIAAGLEPRKTWSVGIWTPSKRLRENPPAVASDGSDDRAP